MDETIGNKAAFVAYNRLYKNTRIPFGLKNDPATFQTAMDIILSSVKRQYAVVYIDCIIIFSKTPM